MDAAVEACGIPPKPRVAVLPELFTIGYRLDLIPGAALELEASGNSLRRPRKLGYGSRRSFVASSGIVKTVPVFRSLFLANAEKVTSSRAWGSRFSREAPPPGFGISE
jgi:hypothetical protein